MTEYVKIKKSNFRIKKKSENKIVRLHGSCAFVQHNLRRTLLNSVSNARE